MKSNQKLVGGKFVNPTFNENIKITFKNLFKVGTFFFRFETKLLLL